MAIQLRDKVELDLHERYSDLMVAAAISKQRLERQQTPDISALLDTLARNFPSYAWIGLVQPDGTVIASTGGLLQGMNVGHRPWFQSAREGPFLGDAHEAALLADKLENDSPLPLRFVDIAVPLKSADGELMGVLGAHLYLHWVENIGESLLAPLQERLKSELIVANEDGKVLIGPEGSVGKPLNDQLLEATRSNQSGHLTTSMAFEGSGATEEYLVGYSQLRDRAEYAGFNWQVLVRKQADEAFMPAQDLRNTILGVGALMAMLLILLASSTARRTTQPLLQMAREARNLDPNNPDTLIRMRDDYEEVKVLSTVLRDLIQRLADKTRETNELNMNLERRVADRTLALEKANRKLEETARTDVLTGLDNRRYLFELGKTALKKAVRSGRPVTTIMFDVDLFKKVNDTYGHAVGDKALVHLSALARQAIRDIDILARLGGEEFAILLENTTEEEAAEVAERLRTGIHESPLPLERGSLGLSVSVGVSTLIPESSDDLDTLLGRADKALYAAKAAGRNRVCLYSAIQ
ncbi:sensor domain-containing diguanylate cyclase [Marinobacter confluentis]|uniref:diguanylate cyclase n=1 Tax=Marinobacter confluentis TaxID=1697557 RepID=A0A4Z1C0U1_9GAMM|nr:diguanylate cyclase [Marinobacter confluentis]TGN39523.1 GGDEF domain-containing protein [Marinobacter confluentis]